MKDKIMVKVSVLMPIYRTREDFLRAAIESILHQTYKDFEFIILDDFPEDNREHIVKSYNDARIKYYKNNSNIGISPSRNKLIEMAMGEYLAVMDHDDISLPERLAKQVEYLDNHQDVGVVGCFIHKIVANKNVKLPVEDEDIKSCLMMKCVINHPSSMIRKKVLIDNNIRYEEKFTPAEDYKLWCKLMNVTKFHNIPEILFKYRDWKNNTTSIQSNKMKKSTREIWAENQINHPTLWLKFNSINAVHISTIRLFGFIPFIKIKQSRERKHILLFDFIPILKIKTSIKV